VTTLTICFSIDVQVGLIALSPFDQQVKIKMYRDDAGACKGDASVCYNAETSVTMAINILSGGYIRPSSKITVSKAEFSAKKVASGDNPTHHEKRPKMSTAQYKVAQSAMKNALAWNEDDDIGVGSKDSSLKIVVLEGMFKPSDFDSNPNFAQELEDDIATECSKCGEIKKITVFSQHANGIVIIKFSTAFAAQECINLTNGRYFGGQHLKSYFWDGATNYGAVSLKQRELEELKEDERLDEFGDWLDQDQEDLPDEFKLNVED
jgi:HIV Tat-specific factor 1